MRDREGGGVPMHLILLRFSRAAVSKVPTFFESAPSLLLSWSSRLRLRVSIWSLRGSVVEWCLTHLPADLRRNPSAKKPPSPSENRESPFIFSASSVLRMVLPSRVSFHDTSLSLSVLFARQRSFLPLFERRVFSSSVSLFSPCR